MSTILDDMSSYIFSLIRVNLNKQIIKGQLMKTISEVVIERLYKYMREQNLTQYKLAQLSGIPFATIKSIMQKRTKGITLKTIIMIADGLKITPSEFLNDPAFLAENLDLD